MRIFLFSFLVSLMFCCAVQAQSPIPQIGIPGCGSLVPSAQPAGAMAPNGCIPMVPSGTIDPATMAWVNAVVTAGGTVSAAQQARVNTLITSLKAHGLWTIQDRIWLHASENTQQATIDIVNLGVATPHGALTFTTNQGYTGDASTAYLDTGFNPSTAGGNFTLNFASLGSYLLNNRGTGSVNYVAVGLSAAGGAAPYAYQQPLQSGTSQFFWDLNGGSFPTATPVTSTRGAWLTVRNGSSANSSLYKNNSLMTTTTDASTSIPNGNIFILALSEAGTPALFSADQNAITTIGGGMNGTQAPQFQTDLNAYMRALGTSVY